MYNEKKSLHENSFYIMKHFVYICAIKNQMNGQAF